MTKFSRSPNKARSSSDYLWTSNRPAKLKIATKVIQKFWKMKTTFLFSHQELLWSNAGRRESWPRQGRLPSSLRHVQNGIPRQVKSHVLDLLYLASVRVQEKLDLPSWARWQKDRAIPRKVGKGLGNLWCWNQKSSTWISGLSPQVNYKPIMNNYLSSIRLGRYQNSASAMEDLLNSYSDADITGAEAKSDAKLCIIQVSIHAQPKIDKCWFFTIDILVHPDWRWIPIRSPPRNRRHSSSEGYTHLRFTRSFHRRRSRSFWKIHGRIRSVWNCSWRGKNQHSSTKNATLDTCRTLQGESWYNLQVWIRHKEVSAHLIFLELSRTNSISMKMASKILPFEHSSSNSWEVAWIKVSVIVQQCLIFVQETRDFLQLTRSSENSPAPNGKILPTSSPCGRTTLKTSDWVSKKCKTSNWPLRHWMLLPISKIIFHYFGLILWRRRLAGFRDSAGHWLTCLILNAFWMCKVLMCILRAFFLRLIKMFQTRFKTCESSNG